MHRPLFVLAGTSPWTQHEITLNSNTAATAVIVHGTSELFQMKHRLTESLAREKGLAVFAIEANRPEVRRVNEYVLTGRVDPEASAKRRNRVVP